MSWWKSNLKKYVLIFMKVGYSFRRFNCNSYTGADSRLLTRLPIILSLVLGIKNNGVELTF